MKFHIYEVIDSGGEQLFVFVREDDFFKCINRKEVDRPEFAMQERRFVDVNSAEPARCWTHVFLEEDEEVNIVALEVEEQDVVPAIKMYLILE